MIDPDVRRATPGDAGDLALLEGEARADLVDARGGARWLDEHPLIGPHWIEALATRAVYVAVLEPPDHAGILLVGYLVLDRHDQLAVVDQVYVTTEARELGFGDALLAAAFDDAVATGATLLEGQALPGDRNTKNLYERAGITARLITVSKRLR